MPEKRPTNTEYAPFYNTYVSQVPVGPILDTLRLQRESSRELLERVPEEAGDHQYAEGKWSIKELLGHVVDTDRIFAFRALHFARSAPGAIPGMEQDDFAAIAPYSDRPLASIAKELHMLRGANLEQFAYWDEAVLDRTGVASGLRFSVRALLHIMAGHERHHMRVLRERYL
jgi:uncharacterized damage-inducible protein DinB